MVRHGATTEPKKMFGGVAFMVNGHMCVGITNKGDAMVRFDGARHAEISAWPGAKSMTYGSGEMKDFLFVDAASLADDRSLDRWLQLALEHVLRLPPKAAKAPAMNKGKRTKKGG